MYDVTYNEILERMLSRVSDKFDKREGSVIFDTHSPTALELEILYVELNTLIAEAYGDSASREFLIRRCKERGITPYEATYAVLKGEFTPANIDVAGQRFNIGSMNFIDEFSVWQHTNIQDVSENVGEENEFVGFEYNMIQFTKDEFILQQAAHNAELGELVNTILGVNE